MKIFLNNDSIPWNKAQGTENDFTPLEADDKRTTNACIKRNKPADLDKIQPVVNKIYVIYMPQSGNIWKGDEQIFQKGRAFNNLKNYQTQS